MKRKSGLADSPFFKQPTAVETVFQSPQPIVTPPPESSKSERQHVDKSTRAPVNTSTSKHVYMYTFLNGEEGKPTSFRLPPQMMEKFNDIFHQVNRQYKTSVKRYAIVVAALALLFWDFEQNGQESDFYKLLIEPEANGRA